jgi:hypothetical protein
MVKKQSASKRFYEALEGIIWGSILEYFSDRESMEYSNPVIEGEIFSWKDDLFGSRYGLRLAISDPVLAL